MRSIWKTLGIAATRDRAAIRRAYAARLKVTNPEDDAAGFQALRAAYEQALARANAPYEFVADLDDDDDDEDFDAGTARAPLADEPPAGAWDEAPSATHSGLEDLRNDRRRERALAAEAVARRRGLDELRGRLAEAVRRAPDQAPAALDALLASPALEDVGLHRQAEDWLAELIVHARPASDPIIAAAVARFEWERRAGSLDSTYDIEQVLARARDLPLLDQLRRGRHPMSAAFRLLSEPPARRGLQVRLKTPFLRPQVRDLLAKIDHYHPTLRADLDPDALEAWEARLARPGDGPMTWLIAAGAPVLLALISMALALQDGEDPLVSVWPFAALGAAAIATLLVRRFLFQEARWRWRDDWVWRAPAWTRVGWLGAAVAALTAGALLPTHPVSLAVAGLLSLAAMVWAFAVGGDGDGEPVTQRFGATLWLNVMLVGCWGVAMWGRPVWTVVQGALPLLGAVVAFSFATGTLVTIWYHEWRQPRRRAAIGGLISLGAAALALGYRAGGSAWMQSLTLLCAVTVVLLQRIPAARLGPNALRWRYYLTMALVIGGWKVVEYFQQPLAATGGFVLIAGALLSLSMALVAETRAREA